MATPTPQIKCGLCNATIGPREGFFRDGRAFSWARMLRTRLGYRGEIRATGDFLPKGDPLTHMCNTPVHWPCYAKWPERPRFARHYVDAWVQANRRNPFWWAVHRDEHVYVSINPNRGVEEVSVRLYALGCDVRVPLPRWTDWLADFKKVTPKLHDHEAAALREVLPALRARFPNDHALVDAINPDEKRPVRRRPATSPAKA